MNSIYKIDALADIVIGKELDSGTLDIIFDVSEWQNVYSELEHYRIEASAPNGLIYIPTEVKLEGNHLIWTITEADTAHDGKGAYQIVATGANGQRKTSDSRSLYVGKIIDGTDAADPPEPSKPWVDAVLDAAKRAEEAAERAESAGGGSVTPEQIGQAVEDYLTKNPVEVTETDPTVPAWAKEPNKPAYTAEEVGAQPKGDYALKSEIPSVPVQSVNKKTGAVQLTADDVGAASKETVERLSEENEKLANNLANITAPKKVRVPIEFTEEVSYILSASNGMPSSMANYNTAFIISSPVSVVGGEVVIITANATYNNYIYAFYDAVGAFVSGEKDLNGGDGGTKLTDKLVIVPKNAKTLRIAFTSYRQPALGRYGGNEVQLRKWQDKIWVVIGDSLTEKNSRTAFNYHDYIVNATGINVINMGLSGTGYANGASANNAFYQRVANVPTNADVVTIFGSGNDMSSGLSLGTPTDTGTETLCGCINTTIDNLVAIMPAVSLGIVSPTPWVGASPANADSNMAKYCAAMKTICENRSIPFLDLFYCSNLRPWTEEGRAACYTKDDGNGVHPDEKGHALIAPRFKAFIETLIL